MSDSPIRRVQSDQGLKPVAVKTVPSRPATNPAQGGFCDTLAELFSRFKVEAILATASVCVSLPPVEDGPFH
ncbi:MAG: hypothetical protein VR74_09350 [Hyphomonas sp. BRH_c22]|uniref:hypothetical protein n=1 Tax=Hyphomonas sp. BRH_c22 TaxID=1629710 RepID=UPI0005F261A1|nr:hypothetical protein [Hyphomonas sp. BRH_c22]KJS37258.1 MAG: hypothetical protein VR74_09350 [Hyphomonas sp. BRH_c22]